MDRQGTEHLDETMLCKRPHGRIRLHRTFKYLFLNSHSRTANASPRRL